MRGSDVVALGTLSDQEAHVFADKESKYARPDTFTDEGALSYPNEGALAVSDDKGALARPNKEALAISNLGPQRGPVRSPHSESDDTSTFTQSIRGANICTNDGHADGARVSRWETGCHRDGH